MSVPALRIAFREWFGLSPSEADILVVLFDAEGRCIGTQILAERTGMAINSITVRMVGIREALDSEAIDHVRGEGYRLTEEGRSECRAAAWRIAEELKSVS